MSKLQTLKPRVQVVNLSRLPVMQPGSWRNDKQSSSARGYGYAWQLRRAQHLRTNPLCVYCLRDGKVTVATVADHIIPHRGDPVLFAGEIQSLCKNCHDVAKRMEELNGTGARLG